MFWNLAIIVGLVIGVPTQDGESGKLYVYAGSIVVGTLIQFLLPLPWLRGFDGRLRVVVDWRDPAVRRFFVLLLPVTVGLGLINVNAVIDTVFASRLIDASLAPTAIDKAFRLYMLPQGMFSVAVATVLFPGAVATRGENRSRQFRKTVALGVRQIAFLLVPAAAVSAVLAEPIVRIVYQRGEFTPDQTTVVAGALAAFSLGLVFNGWMLMLNRAFFSLQSNWLPTAIALANLALNAVLDAALYRVGSGGSRSRPRSSTSWAPPRSPTRCVAGLDTRVESDARLALARRGRLGVGVGVAYPLWWGARRRLSRPFGAQIVSLAVALLAAGSPISAVCRVLRVAELTALRQLLRRSPTRDRPSSGHA